MPPPNLTELLTWFAQTITVPLQENNQLEDHPNISKYILPSPTLKPKRRIEIYHQQYWWRLIRILQENFPFTLRLFGYRDFNKEIAIPFLTGYPPSHWALSELGETLPLWIKKEYRENDKELVLAASEIDRAAIKSFYVKNKPEPDYQSSDLTSRPLTLQSHVHLFHFPCDLFSFRELFLKHDVDYWNKHSFPELPPKESYFILYRDTQNFVTWEEISYPEFFTLCCFSKGISIDEVCSKIETEPQSFQEIAEAHFPFWFKKWTASKFFAHFIPFEHKLQIAKRRKR